MLHNTNNLCISYKKIDMIIKNLYNITVKTTSITVIFNIRMLVRRYLLCDFTTAPLTTALTPLTPSTSMALSTIMNGTRNTTHDHCCYMCQITHKLHKIQIKFLVIVSFISISTKSM